jgi:hypothetical protein
MSGVHKWLVGFFLAVLMVTVLAICSFLFSARSFQFNLAQVSPGTNGILSVEQLDEVDAEIRKIEADTAGPRGERRTIEDRLSVLNGEIEAQQRQISQTMADLALTVAQLEDTIGSAAGAQPAASLDSEQLEARAASLISTPGLQAQHSSTASNIREGVVRLRQLEGSVAAREQERRELQVNQRRVGGLVAESDNRIIALKQTIVDDYANYDRIRSEAQALRNTSPLNIGTSLVSAHPTFMSTLLVLLMGALGAILYLFPAYMGRPNPVTFAEIIVRMIFGMVTALAFYIVANATIAGLSFVPGQAAQANAALLNPFTVGLVGIVAGIMADDIAKWIQRRGSEILGGRQGATAASADSGFSGVNPHGGPPPV